MVRPSHSAMLDDAQIFKNQTSSWKMSHSSLTSGLQSSSIVCHGADDVVVEDDGDGRWSIDVVIVGMKSCPGFLLPS
jgi:hypothetical protein